MDDKALEDERARLEDIRRNDEDGIPRSSDDRQSIALDQIADHLLEIKHLLRSQ